MREPPVPTKQAKMVGWYNADVLAQSAWMMTVANLFGRHSDSRLIEALSNQPQGVFRFEADASDGEFWFDFVSDVGDGFNPTYTVARGIAGPSTSMSSGSPSPPTPVRASTCAGSSHVCGSAP
jgi:hypothetical protein